MSKVLSALPVNLIVAKSINNAIGSKCAIPWKLPEDLRYFSFVTRNVPESEATSKCNAVVMGRRTWESIPEQFRPLKDRLNVVLSRGATMGEQRVPIDSPKGSVLTLSSLTEALATLNRDYSSKLYSIFIIGGGAVYEEAARQLCFNQIFITRVGTSVPDADVFFPDFHVTDHYDCVAMSKTRAYEGIPYDFTIYESKRPPVSRELKSEVSRVRSARPNELEGLRSCGGVKKPDPIESFIAAADSDTAARDEGASVPAPITCPMIGTRRGSHEELQYLDLVSDIINTGVPQSDRTGVGTFAKFGATMRFSLEDGVFPLLTTKRVYWKGVVEELLWFLKGSTCSKALSAKGVKIWDANGSRAFLDSRGLTDYEEGDLGPVYGFQWRHFGALYRGMNHNYEGEGVDQLQQCIDTLKSRPTDRRIVLSAWNPADLDKMALPPCHMFCQFLSDENKNLCCILYQRSCDMGLGVPFNIASYALLTRIVAELCGLNAKEFVHVLGNAHVYRNHVEPLIEQLQREPRPFPVLKFSGKIQAIGDLKGSQFVLEGYNPHPPVKMEMAV